MSEPSNRTKHDSVGRDHAVRGSPNQHMEVVEYAVRDDDIAYLRMLLTKYPLRGLFNHYISDCDTLAFIGDKMKSNRAENGAS